jgi:hypothetical protein
MKHPHRRQFLHLAAGAAALPAVSRIASAQTYPTRPVRWIVGFHLGDQSTFPRARLLSGCPSGSVSYSLSRSGLVRAAILPSKRSCARPRMATPAFQWAR